MIGVELHHGEERQHGCSAYVAAAVDQHQAGDCRRDVGECDEFPYMSGAYDDDEVGRESPGDRAKQSIVPAHLHHEKQDEEAEHHHKQQIGWSGQAETIDRIYP